MLQMKLSGSTIAACDDLEEMWFGDYDTGISRSFIVSRALAEIFPKRNEVEWEEVNWYAKANYDGEGVGRQTALDLNDDEIEKLTIMQKEFVTVFGTKKIYKPFVVKMIVVAELFYKGMEKGEEEAKREELSQHVLTRIGTLNVQGAGREKNDIGWKILEENFARNEIMALQEFVPGEDCKWINRCKSINGVPYKVITPVGWNKENTGWTIAVTLIRSDVIKKYEPLTINDDKDTLSARYTYGIVTFKDNTKIRLMNVYMPQLADADAKRVAAGRKFWNSVLEEIESIPADEKLIILGDFNSGKDRKFKNHDNFLKLCKRMAMLDADKEYDTWFSGKARNRLDYIFISNSMATEYTAITNQYEDALEFNVTDHMMIEAAFIKQEPFKEYCERILAYYNEQ